MATKPSSSKTHNDLVFESLETPQNHRVESSFLVDLRSHPRFDTDLPGETISESGENMPVSITNISLTGLRLEGSQKTVGALLADIEGRAPDTESEATFEVSFSVPTDSNELYSVKVLCRTVYARPVEEDTYQIGMKFVTFQEGHKSLVEYLSFRGAAR